MSPVSAINLPRLDLDLQENFGALQQRLRKPQVCLLLEDATPFPRLRFRLDRTSLLHSQTQQDNFTSPPPPVPPIE